MKANIGFLVILLFAFLPIKVYGSSESLLIVFSGEETGNLEPCGCYEGQIGGISRRYTLIDFFRGDKDVILPVSLGDLPKSSGRQEEIKMEIFCRAIGEMDYILHNLGEKDIEIGPQLINYLSHTSKTVLLSSNVQLVASFPAKINQYVLKECFVSGHTLKIAFLGILSKSLLNNYVLEYINVKEPIQALKPLVKQLQEEANLIVLLSHASLSESIEIAKFFPEIGLIITGHNIEEPTDSITYINNTPVVSPGIEGKYVGIAKYSINNAVVERKSVEVISLESKYKDSLEMLSLLKEYQQILADEDLLSKIPQIPLSNDLSYVGGATCGKCHTTGNGYVSGFLNYEKNSSLINIGCESCHGAGSRHIKYVTEPYGVTDESDCVICHESEHSPKFQYSEYWKKIKHPEEIVKKIP